jgi:hypothetical protein
VKKTLIIFLLTFSCINFAFAENIKFENINIIDFNKFFKKPIGSLGLEIDTEILKLNNKYVQLSGFMEQRETDPIGKFMLSPRPLKSTEDADGEASDLPASATLVLLDQSQKDMIVPFRQGLITVQGVLKIGRFEQEDGSVNWFRIELAPDAIKVTDIKFLTKK